MNKAFKVLWNQVRNTYVVASEAQATHGKPGKATKTIVAAAVAGLMAMGSTAFAADTLITNDSFGNEEGQYNSTKFISGHGGNIDIQTSGDTRELFKALKNAIGNPSSENIKNLLGALGTANGSTLVGFAGGTNVVDASLAELLPTLGDLVATQVTDPQVQAQLQAGFEKLAENLKYVDKDKTQQIDKDHTFYDVTSPEDINITIGSEGENEPLLIGSVAGDRLVNSSTALEFLGSVADPYDAKLLRKNDVTVTVNSGNLISFVGGSSAINVGGVEAGLGSFLSYHLQGKSTTVELQGDTQINLNGSTTSAGVLAGGSAIAISGAAKSTVTGTSEINVGVTSKGSGFKGLNVGLSGGGLSVATLGGTSEAKVGGDTTINLNSGISGLVMGGGIAASADISQVIDKFNTDHQTLSKLVTFNQDLVNKGGTALSESQNINIKVGSGATVFGLMGGGTAAAYQVESAEQQSKATANVKDVTITIGEEGKGSAFTDVDSKDKSEFFGALKDVMAIVIPENLDSIKGTEGVMDALKDVLASVSVDENENKIQQSIDTVASHPGVTVGVLGGGIAASWAREDSGSATSMPTAEATVDSVTMAVHSGYNVGLVGGGLAMASAADAGDKSNTAATATVGDGNPNENGFDGVNMVFDGGETIGVMGGGIAVFSGSAEQHNGIGALSKVSSVTIGLTGENTSIDGVVLGGMAIDDTNPTDDGTPDGQPVATKNAFSEVTGTAKFVADSGSLNRLNLTAFVNQENQWPHNPNVSQPGMRDHWDSLAYAVEHQNVALVGGGLASGIRVADETETGGAHVNEVNITLRGDVVVGEEGVKANVFGGGIAANGAKASVNTVNIAVAEDAQVHGDIYAGGIAQDGAYLGNPAPDYYNKSESVVDTATISILGGTVYGNLYAGGLVSAVSDQEALSSSTVKNSTIVLADADAFQGDVIDGSNTDKSVLQFELDQFDMTDKSVSAFNEIQSVGASVKNLDYTFGEKGQTTVTGDVAFGTLGNAEDAGKTLLIGGEDAAGAVSVKALGSALNLTVSNGLLALNVDSTDDAIAAYAGAGAKNAVYVTGTVDDTYLHKGSKVTVGDVADAQNPGIYVGADGALIADADGDTTVSANLEMRNGSKVHFADVAQAAAGDKKVIADIDATIATSVDNVLYTATRNENGEGGVYFTFGQRSASELEEVGLGDVDDIAALNDIATQSDDASDYINMFMDQSTGSIDSSNRSQQINAAMNLAAAAGVQTVAIDSATMGIDAAAKRASVINDFAEGGVLFAEATGKRFEMGGTSDFGAIKTELGGIVVGGEYTTGDWTFGALANLGTGTVRGQDANSGVKNDVDYYGVQAYAAKRLGAFNVVGQVGYVQTSNDVTHTTVGMEKADIDANVMSVGVRGEMRFDISENARLVPYVGVNYLRVSTDGFDTDQGLEVKDQDQDLVTIPVGVKFAGDMQSASGWTWTPSVDVGYVAALGDRDSDARTKVGATTVHTSMDVWSESVVRTSVGLKAQKDNWGFGVQAGSAMGSDDTKELFGQVRVDYRF